MSFKSQKLKIQLGPKVLVDVGQAALETIKEQTSEGVSSNGETHDFDWRKSGQLMDTAEVSDDGVLQWPAPHAEIVEARFPFAGIAPQYQENFNKRLQPILQAGLVFEKEG